MIIQLAGSAFYPFGAFCSPFSFCSHRHCPKVPATAPLANPREVAPPPAIAVVITIPFNGQVSSGTIGQLPFSLASLKPGGNYCDLEGEGQIDQTMQQIPFTIGPYTITQLPHTLNLNYKTYTQQTNHGPACPPPPRPIPLITVTIVVVVPVRTVMVINVAMVMIVGNDDF